MNSGNIETRTSADKKYVAGLEKGLAIIEAFGMLKSPVTRALRRAAPC
jgi:hypothetical protein